MPLPLPGNLMTMHLIATTAAPSSPSGTGKEASCFVDANFNPSIVDANFHQKFVDVTNPVPQHLVMQVLLEMMK